jgi:hypothetical protein
MPSRKKHNVIAGLVPATHEHLHWWRSWMAGTVAGHDDVVQSKRNQNP